MARPDDQLRFQVCGAFGDCTDALLPPKPRHEPAPPAHSTIQRLPNEAVLLCHPGEFAFPLIRQELVGVVVVQSHCSAASLLGGRWSSKGRGVHALPTMLGG